MEVLLSMIVLSPFWIILLLIILPIMVRQINQYERGVLFTLGKFTKIKQPGWRFVLPIFQSMVKIDIRIKAVDVPIQDTITKDNIPIKISAVVYYKVVDVAKALIEVENYYNAILQLAQTSIRSGAGGYTLDQLLSNRKAISEHLHEELDSATELWGVDVSSVELKDIELPESLKTTIAKVAEAEREKKAVIIKSEGDKLSAMNLAEAAQTLTSTPGGMHLRTLQSLNELASEQGNATVWLLPLEVMDAFRKMGGK